MRFFERFLGRGSSTGQESSVPRRESEKRGKTVSVPKSPSEMLEAISDQKLTNGFETTSFVRQMHYIPLGELRSLLDHINKLTVETPALATYKQIILDELSNREKEETTIVGRARKFVRELTQKGKFKKETSRQDVKNTKGLTQRVYDAAITPRRSEPLIRQEPAVQPKEEVKTPVLDYARQLNDVRDQVFKVSRLISEDIKRATDDLALLPISDRQGRSDLLDEIAQLQSKQSLIQFRFNELASAFYSHLNNPAELENDSRWSNLEALQEELSLVGIFVTEDESLEQAPITLLPTEAPTFFDVNHLDQYFRQPYLTESQRIAEVHDEFYDKITDLWDLLPIPDGYGNDPYESFVQKINELRGTLLNLRNESLRQLFAIQSTNGRVDADQGYAQRGREIEQFGSRIFDLAQEILGIAPPQDRPGVSALDALDSVESRTITLEQEEDTVADTESTGDYRADALLNYVDNEIDDETNPTSRRNMKGLRRKVRRVLERIIRDGGDLEEDAELQQLLDRLEGYRARRESALPTEVAAPRHKAQLEVVRQVNATEKPEGRVRGLFNRLRQNPQVRDALIVTGVQVVANAAGGLSMVATAAGAPVMMGLQERRIRGMDEDQLQEHVVGTYGRMTRDYAETWSRDEKNVILRHVKAAAGLGMNALKFVADARAKVLIGADRTRNQISDFGTSISDEADRPFNADTVISWLQSKLDAATNSQDPSLAAGALEQLSALYTRLHDALILDGINTPAYLSRRLTDKQKETAWGQLLTGKHFDETMIDPEMLQGIVDALQDKIMGMLNNRKVINELLWKTQGRAQGRLSRAMESLLEKTQNPEYKAQRLRKMSRNLYWAQFTGAATNALVMDSLTGRLADRVDQFESQYTDIVNKSLQRPPESPAEAQEVVNWPPRPREFRPIEPPAEEIINQAPPIREVPIVPETPLAPPVPEVPKVPNLLKDAPADYRSVYEQSLNARGIKVPEGTISLDGDGIWGVLGDTRTHIETAIDTFRTDWPDFNEVYSAVVDRGLGEQYLQIVNDAMATLHRTLTAEEYRQLAVQVGTNIVPDGQTTIIENFALGIGNRKDLLTQMGIGQ